MRGCTILLVLGLLILEHASCMFETRTPHIAVIGGGIGGASTSHFLTELMNGNLEIDLYEAKRIGGRLATVKIGKNEYEAGGSIIHPKNMYMQKFVKLLGLEHTVPGEGIEKIGIWNGDEFVFKVDSSWSIVPLIKLVHRYGFQVFKLQRDLNYIIEDFGKIYELQNAGEYFTNITALMSATNKEFPELLQVSMKDHLLHMGYSERLIDELAEAIMVVNYGQDTDAQSFVGLVSLAATNSDLWSVKGGNKEVPEHLIYRNRNVNVAPSRVTKIRYMAADDDSRQYEVTYMNKDSTDSMTAEYHIVILAIPLTSDQEFPIEFVNFPKDLRFPGAYQTTHATFVQGDIKPKYFGLDESLDTIFSCNPTKTIISSVGEVNSVNEPDKNGSPVWKIFSRKPLGTELLHEMFSNVTEKKTFAWKAYPHYLSNTCHNSFKLHDALYHVNAIEWVASAMEMSAIGGRNVAILAYNDFLQKHGLMQHEEVYKDIPTAKHEHEL